MRVSVAGIFPIFSSDVGVALGVAGIIFLAVGMIKQPQKADSNDFLIKGSINRSIYKLALPTFVGNILFVTLNIVDMYFVGKLGVDALATVAVGQTIAFTLWIAVEGIYMATIAMVSRAVGAKDAAHAREVATQALIMGIVSSLSVGFIGFAFSDQLLLLLGVSESVLILGLPYLEVMCLGFIVMAPLFLSSAIMRGAGDVITPMKVFAFSTVFNIILDPLLIFGVWLFPELGVVGSAWASVIARFAGAVLALYVLFSGRSREEIHLHFNEIRLDFSLMLEILKIGLYQSIEGAQWSFRRLIMMRIAANFGPMAQAVMGVGLRAGMLVEIVSWGLGSSAATLVGQNLGAKNPQRAQDCAYRAARFGMLFAVFTGSIFFIAAPQIMAVFVHEQHVVKAGTVLLRFLAPTYIFTVWWMVFGRALKGAGDTRSPMYITLGVFLIFQIALVLLLVLVMDVGMNGMWFSMAAANVLAGIAARYWFSCGKWKKITFTYGNNAAARGDVDADSLELGAIDTSVTRNQ